MIGLCVVGLTLDAVSVCAEDNWGALEETHPTVPLPTITVEARSPAFDPAFEINSITVLNAFDLPGRPLHDSRTLIAGLLELQGDFGPWAGFLGTSIDHYDDFGTHPTLYAGLSRWATPTLKLHASGGRGYRLPAFHELYFVLFFGNPNLIPEQGWSGDLGLDWEPDTAPGSRSPGYQRFDDLIQLTLAPTLSLLVGENVPEARIWGFEIEGSQSWGHGVTTGIDY